jgi:hypothetical protein
MFFAVEQFLDRNLQRRNPMDVVAMQPEREIDKLL